MNVRIILRDYRCFRREQPAVIEIKERFYAYVGPNNAGKSTILKSFYELRLLYQHIAALYGTWGHNFENHHNFNYPPPITDNRELLNNSRTDPELSVEIELLEVFNTAERIPIHKVIATYSNRGWKLKAYTALNDSPLGQEYGNQIVAVNGIHLQHHSGRLIDGTQIQSVAQRLSQSLYIGAFRNAINEGAGHYFDLRVGTSFIELWHQWKTGGSKEQNKAMLRVTSEIAHLLGVGSLEINASLELKTLQLHLDGEPYKLSELGAGIAELIVVLANASILQPELILIDEPEAHLHPKLQIEFLTNLGSHAKTSLLYSTHVLGLARAVADQTFSIQKTVNGSALRILNKTPNYAEFLGSLGLSSLQEIGYDTILLVEGVTEVRTFQQFLRILGLDQRVVILPLGGSGLINGKVGPELGEVVRLCPRIFAVIDSEKSGVDVAIGAERKAFLDICKNLRINCMATSKTATENYFSDRAIKLSVGPQFRALGEFEKPSSIPWGKSTNWLIASEMSRDEVLATDIGVFLNSIAS